MLPKPWHVGQAPNGLLNENSRGWGSSYGIPHGRHSKRSENLMNSEFGSDVEFATAQAAPVPPESALLTDVYASY